MVHILSYNQVLEDSYPQALLSFFKDSSQLSSITNPNLSSRINSSIGVVAHVSGVFDDTITRVQASTTPHLFIS